MSQGCDEKILAKIEEVQRSLAILQKAVVGDKHLGGDQPGLVDVISAHKRELYGDSETKDEGLKHRIILLEKEIEDLDDERKRMKWMSAGISFGISVAWGAAVYWFTRP